MKKKEVNKKINLAFTKAFYAAFNLKAPQEDKVEGIVQKFLLDKSIEIHKEVKKLTVISTQSFVSFAKTHSREIIDFKYFPAGVSGIQELSEYAKDTKCSIKLIKIPSSITQNERDLLEKAVKARSGSLKVEYYIV